MLLKLKGNFFAFLKLLKDKIVCRTQNQNLYSLSLKEAIVHADAHGADDLCKALIARIEEVNPKVNAFLRFDGEKSLISSNQKGLLKGVPIALKDNICVDGLEVDVFF
jgi:Asp-tRNA(Asn)/Glu-tRNA(Gln) amidotransferase A subunit family amidase